MFPFYLFFFFYSLPRHINILRMQPYAGIIFKVIECKRNNAKKKNT